MRILVLADIHGNAEALHAVLSKAGRFDEVIVLGDLVDYGPDPGMVIDEVKALSPVLWVRGNHDQYMAGRHRCWGEQGLRSAARETRAKITRRLVSRKELRMLSSKPSIAAVNIGNLKIIGVHASPRDPLCSGIYPWHTLKRVLRALSPASRLMEADIILAAHTHIPVHLAVSGSLTLLNPGSVGQPRDGDPRASFAVIDPEKGVFMGRASYNAEKTIARIREFMLDDRATRILEQTLRTGITPKPSY